MYKCVLKEREREREREREKERERERDCVLKRNGILTLPEGLKLGTSTVARIDSMFSSFKSFIKM